MRWLFLFVLLVNVVYVSWELSQSTDGSTVRETSTDIPGIELLSEIGQATRVMDEEVAGASKPTQAVKPATSVAARPSFDQLGADRCYTLGPFRELDNLRNFTRAIKNYVISASFRSREEQEQSMFWVYLEPEASLRKAKVLGKRLKRMKIKDYYVINSGLHEKGISLGHFKGKDRAYAHAGQVKKLGFKPVVEPVFRSYTIYWLDYRVPVNKVIPRKIFTKRLTKKINLLDRSCS